MEVGGQRHALAALPPGEARYPFHRRMGWPQGRSGRVRKIVPPTGDRFPDRPAFYSQPDHDPAGSKHRDVKKTLYKKVVFDGYLFIRFFIVQHTTSCVILKLLLLARPKGSPGGGMWVYGLDWAGPG